MRNRRVAVVGAGVYGCVISILLAEDFPDFHITLYEKNKDICMEAATNNQHRIHKGFHYPRSPETISQILKSYDLFMSKFSNLTKKTKHNYYLIDKDSKVNFIDYKNVFSDIGVWFKEIKLSDLNHIIKVDKIEGCISTDEEVIELKKMKNFFSRRIKDFQNIKLVLNHKVDSLEEEDFDFVINCTYTNPNLFIEDKENIFKLKYESCLIPVIDNVFKDDISFTIMDGPFLSAYQTGDNRLTLSSVVHTPYFKSNNLCELIEKMNSDKENVELLTYEIGNIMNHFSQYFYDINSNVRIYETYFSPKVKLLDDKNDLREAYVIKNDNIFSVLCGKITASVEIYNKIKEYICE